MIDEHRAIGALLRAGKLGAAAARIAAVPIDQLDALDLDLAPIWGTGRAPAAPRMLGIPKGVGGGSGYGAGWLLAAYARRWLAWRVVRAADGAHVGSAAVVDGAWFRADLAGAPLVLTCAHVCSSFARAPGRPAKLDRAADAALEWWSEEEEWRDGSGARARVPCVEILDESPVDELDYALLRVRELPAAARPPAGDDVLHELVGGDRIYMWSYPGADPLTLSVNENQVREVDGRYFGYQAFAEGGSSGAPLFYDRGHQLVGLHRGEDPATGTRHAVFFEIIFDELRRRLARR